MRQEYEILNKLDIYKYLEYSILFFVAIVIYSIRLQLHEFNRNCGHMTLYSNPIGILVT